MRAVYENLLYIFIILMELIFTNRRATKSDLNHNYFINYIKYKKIISGDQRARPGSEPDF